MFYIFAYSIIMQTENIYRRKKKLIQNLRKVSDDRDASRKANLFYYSEFFSDPFLIFQICVFHRLNRDPKHSLYTTEPTTKDGGPSTHVRQVLHFIKCSDYTACASGKQAILVNKEYILQIKQALMKRKIYSRIFFSMFYLNRWLYSFLDFPVKFYSAFDPENRKYLGFILISYVSCNCPGKRLASSIQICSECVPVTNLHCNLHG